MFKHIYDVSVRTNMSSEKSSLKHASGVIVLKTIRPAHFDDPGK